MKPVNDEFLALIPPSFFRSYLNLMVEYKNETPLPFHFLSIAAVAGQAMGFEEHAYLDVTAPIYPQVNALIIGPSGTTRKSRGTQIAADVAKYAGLNIFEGKATPEALIDAINEKDGNLLFYVDELSTVLTRKDYMSDMTSVLTDLLTRSPRPKITRTRQRGEIIVERSNLNAMFATAPEWYANEIPESAKSGGFWSRMIACYLPGREVVNSNFDPPKGAREKFNKELEAMGMQIAQIKHRLCNVGYRPETPELNAKMTEWYDSVERTPITDDRMRPVYARKPEHCLRLALLFAIMDEAGCIREVDFDAGVAVYEFYERTLAPLLCEFDNMERLTAKGEKRIVDVLKAAEGKELPHAEISKKCLSYFRGGVKDMKSARDNLVEQDVVETTVAAGSAGWPPIKWRLK